jgi:hypothetical protein
MILGYSIDWDKIGQFVQVVGVPFACLLLFVGPFLWVAFSLFRKYGSRMAEAHINFLSSASESQVKNAQTLERLEETIAKNQNGHSVTHKAIGLVADASLAIIDGDHPRAKHELSKVDIVLNKGQA